MAEFYWDTKALCIHAQIFDNSRQASAANDNRNAAMTENEIHKLFAIALILSGLGGCIVGTIAVLILSLFVVVAFWKALAISFLCGLISLLWSAWKLAPVRK